MRKWAVLMLVAVPVLAQEIKLPPGIEKLAEKAVESVDVTLDGALLRMATSFLSDKKGDEAKVKQLVGGLKGIYVRSFEFDKDGQYSPEDVEAIRKQLRGAPGWSRIVSVVEKNEITEVYIKTEGDKHAGLVVLAAEPRELTFVSIAGSIDLGALSDLGGHFGIPKLDLEQDKKPAKD